MKLLSNDQRRALDEIASSPATHVIGIDEVGMGCLAGPIVVAGVVLPAGWRHKDVKDSKALNTKRREKADGIIRGEANAFCILTASNLEIDEEGLHEVHARLTEGVALQCLQWFPQALIVQDGNIPVSIGGRPQHMAWLAKADVHVPQVSAASVLAKVYRDSFMRKMSYEYPGYGFGTNMGYGTNEHMLALKELGACPLHRKSYKPVQAVL